MPSSLLKLAIAGFLFTSLLPSTVTAAAPPPPSNPGGAPGSDGSGSGNVALVQTDGIPPGGGPPDQANACNNPGGVNGIEPSCWDILNMTAYTEAWWQVNQHACGMNANFSTCFFEMHNMGTMDCTGIKPGACTAPNPNGFSARDFYIAYNIYAINQVFFSLYTAIGNANTLASESVGSIISLINPPKNKNLMVDSILVALGVGVAFIIPSGTLLAKQMAQVVQAQPGVGKYLFPSGTTQSQVTQWAQIEGQLGTIVQYYQSNISEVIPIVNNNVSAFIAFASTGAFSVNPLPDLADESNKLLQGLNTYIIAKALTANNIVVGKAPDTDINQLQLNSSDTLSYDTGCGQGYDNVGICGPFWYDDLTNITYSLDNLGQMNKNYHDTMETIFSNWTTGELLFRGANNCAMADDNGDEANLPNIIFGQNGSITMDCLSDVQICQWAFGTLDPDHEFENCPSQQGYIANGCSSCPEDSRPVNVPNGYIGDYLVNANILDCVCNT
ncbi:hypothetical protein MMC21_002771 [Puttea exsequens]|nr:hypothetical protein [Puttea exsequens]